MTNRNNRMENEVDVTPIETITIEELHDRMSEEVTIEVPVTMFGYVAICAGLDILEQNAIRSFDSMQAMDVRLLRQHIGDSNPDVEAEWQNIVEFLENKDRIMNPNNVDTGTPPYIPQDSE